MRFVAKVHVLDVMDRVVVSGYVLDTDPMTDTDHEPLEFTYECLSYGLDDHLEWLLTALAGVVAQAHKNPPGRADGSLVTGGTHTVTGIGDSATRITSVDGGGWGGPGWGAASRSESDQV
jgi:hypothetical protein